jgi:hypothetical protein
MITKFPVKNEDGERASNDILTPCACGYRVATVIAFSLKCFFFTDMFICGALFSLTAF